MKEDKKYVWWGLLGIGVAAFFYFLSSKKSGQTVQVPFLVPSQLPANSSGPSQTDTSVSEQPNIIGSHPNSTIENTTNPQWINNTYPAPNRGLAPPNSVTPIQFQELSPGQLAGTQPISSNQSFGVPWAVYLNPQTGTTYQVQ